MLKIEKWMTKGQEIKRVKEGVDTKEGADTEEEVDTEEGAMDIHLFCTKHYTIYKNQ